jgi:hypothetical protein
MNSLSKGTLALGVVCLIGSVCACSSPDPQQGGASAPRGSSKGAPSAEADTDGTTETKPGDTDENRGTPTTDTKPDPGSSGTNGPAAKPDAGASSVTADAGGVVVTPKPDAGPVTSNGPRDPGLVGVWRAARPIGPTGSWHYTFEADGALSTHVGTDFVGTWGAGDRAGRLLVSKGLRNHPTLQVQEYCIYALRNGGASLDIKCDQNAYPDDASLSTNGFWQKQ